MLLELRRLASQTDKNTRIVGKTVASRIDKAKAAGLLRTEQNRGRLFASYLTVLQRPDEALQHRGLTPVHRVMDCVLEAEAAVPVTWSVQARQHLQLHVLEPACLVNDLPLQRVEKSDEDGANHSCDGCNFIRDCAALKLEP